MKTIFANSLVKKVLIFIIVMLVIAGVVYFRPQRAVYTGDKPVIKIGFIAPLTGDNALIGTKCLQGVELALDKIQDDAFHYELIVENDQFQAMRSVTAANKLLNLDKVDFLYLCSATSGQSVVHLADPKKIFMMSINSSDTRFAAASPYSFLHWVPARKEGEQAVKIFKKYGAKKVLFLVTVHPGSEGMYRGISEEARKAGIEVVKMSIMPHDRDYTTIVQKAVRKGADMWHILVIDPGLTLLGKRMFEQNVKIPYSSSELPNFVQNKAMFEGIYFTDAYEGAPEVIEAYRKKYKTNNVYSVAYAYDAMLIIDKLHRDFFAEHGRLPNGPELSAALQNMQGYSGAVGPVSVDKDGVLQSEAIIRTFRNGEAVSVELE